MSAAEIKRLEERIARAKGLDARARLTDAAMHLRKAIEIIEGAAAPTDKMQRVASLLGEAADLLIEAGDGLPKR